VDPLIRPVSPAGFCGWRGDGALRAELVAKGRERAKQFSWQKAVELTEQAFADITGPDYRKRPFIQVESWPQLHCDADLDMAQFLRRPSRALLSQDVSARGLCR
jgi:hypothetical protein